MYRKSYKYIDKHIKMNDSSKWLSISAASHLLGVHFTTLRRWADQGLIEYIRTPGGKRKFERVAIDEFVNRRRSASSVPQLLARIESETVVITRSDIQEHGVNSQKWYLNLSDDQRVQLKSCGSRLVALLFQYSARNGDRSVFMEAGKSITREFGQICYSVGLTLEESIRTFMFFRKSMMYSFHETDSLKGIGDEEGKRLFEKMTEFLDESLIAMVVEYDKKI